MKSFPHFLLLPYLLLSTSPLPALFPRSLPPSSLAPLSYLPPSISFHFPSSRPFPSLPPSPLTPLSYLLLSVSLHFPSSRPLPSFSSSFTQLPISNFPNYGFLRPCRIFSLLPSYPESSFFHLTKIVTFFILFFSYSSLDFLFSTKQSFPPSLFPNNIGRGVSKYYTNQRKRNISRWVRASFKRLRLSIGPLVHRSIRTTVSITRKATNR